jgi:hemerythrin-like metal-binding protein
VRPVHEGGTWGLSTEDAAGLVGGVFPPWTKTGHTLLLRQPLEASTVFAWSPSLEIGVPEIDAQHRSLFERADQFATAVQSREPMYRLEELFAFLVEYALEHFAAEERYMRGVGYPQLPQHIQEHAQFRRQLAYLVPHWSTEGDSQALLMALMGFLKSWLTEHVTGSDQRIGEYVRSRKS